MPSNNDPEIVYGLGLDTGGTFTDAVIVDLKSKKVLAKAKARTTHRDLSIGLDEAVDRVFRNAGDIERDLNLVGISTTLATNSILEGKGGRVGLICLGWTPDAGSELGAAKKLCLTGGHDVRGRVQEVVRPEEVERAVGEMSPHVDSIVVSSIFSVYNPSHELEVKRIIRGRCGLPVIMGHELTGELGINERTVTAVLNARLIPVLSDFLRKVQDTMRRRNITAPLMVFKGDGTLMNIQAALERPIETIMSGPAASASGGRILSGLDDCFVIDVGGTSTDVAMVEKGALKITEEGATVGGWRTRVEAMDVWTAALGGDSEIRASTEQGVLIGPERVVPLCFAAPYFPTICKRMEEIGQARFYMAFPGKCAGLTPSEGRLVDHLLANGPQTLSELRRDLEDMHLLDMFVKSLKSRGAIVGIGLTPTDILHAARLYTAGDVEAAKTGVRLFAKLLCLSEDEFVRKIMDLVSRRIAEQLLKKLLTDNLGGSMTTSSMQELVELMSGSNPSPKLQMYARLKSPVVGLGAPAKVFITPLASMLNIEVVIPEDHDIGNAVGAVCGHVSTHADVYVYPKDKGYAVYSSYFTPLFFGSETDAVRQAKELATRYALERGAQIGGQDLKVEMQVEQERERSTIVRNEDVLVQMRVRARAVGDPNRSE